MKIRLWADLLKTPLVASVKGDVITINGDRIDLSGIPEGFRLPATAVGNPFFMQGSADFIERVNGELSFTLKFPVQEDSPEEYRNPPEPIILNVVSGKVPFPDASPVVETPEIIEIAEEPENGGLEPVAEN